MENVKPYYEALENFIREIESKDVDALCLVALCNDEDTHNVICNWHASPFDMMTAAGVIQLRAGTIYQEMNGGEEEDEEEWQEE